MLDRHLGRVLALAAVLLAVACGQVVAAPRAQQASAPAQGAFRVLMVTTTAGYRHDSIPLAERVVQRLGQESAGFGVDLLSGLADLEQVSAEGLAAYDVILFANTSGELPLDHQQREALLAFVERGGGFVGVHAATDTLYTWPAYGELVGAVFREHPWVQDAGIVVEDQQHPSTRHLGSGFRILEEIYTFQTNPRSRVHVLLSLDAATVGAAGDYPLTWCTNYGSGRVFYTALGHFDSTWSDTRFQQHLLGALNWAADRSARCG